MGQEGSSTPGSFSHPQRNILMMNFLIQPWEHGQGFWLQKDQWLCSAGLCGRPMLGHQGGGHSRRRDGSPDLTVPLAVRLCSPPTSWCNTSSSCGGCCSLQRALARPLSPGVSPLPGPAQWHFRGQGEGHQGQLAGDQGVATP